MVVLIKLFQPRLIFFLPPTTAVSLLVQFSWRLMRLFTPYLTAFPLPCRLFPGEISRHNFQARFAGTIPAVPRKRRLSLVGIGGACLT